MEITAKHRDSGASIKVVLLGITSELTPSGKATTILGEDGREIAVDSAQFFDSCIVYSDGEEATKTLRALVFPNEPTRDLGEGIEDADYEELNEAAGRG